MFIQKHPNITMGLIFGFTGLLALTLWCADLPAAPPQEKVGLFSSLSKGQKVSVKETVHGFEINVMEGVDFGSTITELDPNYIVLVDLTGTTETRIPVYAIKSIKTVRLPKK